MSNTAWTDAQLEAIKTKYRSNGQSCNILVGAAAGSGKTAVLVERIIQKLIPENISDSIGIDRLLVVTFTNAAAHEMSERIAAALSAEMENAVLSGDTQRKRLIKRQQLLLADSDITTIDAFCLKLIRSHFNLLDIDPNFSIADSAQAALLSDESIDEIFSELYEDKNEDFINLLCLYATSRSDDGLAELVKHIHSFISSVPNPINWLYEKTEELKCENGIKSTQWFKKGYENCKNEIEYALSCIKKGLHIMYPNFDGSFLPTPEKGSLPYDEWKSYYNAFYNEFMLFSSLNGADYDAATEIVDQFEFSRLSVLKSKPDDIKDMLKNLRATVKESFFKIKAFLSVSEEDAERQSREHIYPVILSLAHLVEKYDKRYMEKKLKKNILEFSDVEQLAAKLLSQNPDICNEVKNRYEEVLMDEYQDTSALQEEIFKYVSNGSNLFMVGDMKQSIYRFRNSDPSIFKQKSDLYKDKPDTENRKIILSKNFRSRSEVLDSVNDIFAAIMTEQAGELDYDESQRLYLGNKDYENINTCNTSECCLIEMPPKDSDDEDDLSRTELEARFVASEINRLKSEHFKIRDKNGVRDIENRDIVILMSSYKAAADIYTSELNAAGIECFAESEGYFEKNEIRLMVSLLKIINNPLCDIPLLGVLRSPIASFTDNELVLIRKCAKGRFYNAIKELIRLKNEGMLKSEEMTSTAEKAENFCNNLNRWRKYSRYMPSDKLIWTLYEETDFYAFAGAMHDGEEAQANLRLLFERAKQYENNGFQGLFNFIKYIERLKNKDTDLSSAKLVGEGHNVVRIMTIHKSKGLEFPVVFITGGSKRFNRRQDEPRIILHRKYGIAADYIDFENSYRTETPAKSVFKSIISAEQTSEEIRKLYVALTRAKEKLYFVASIPGTPSESDSSSTEKFLADKQEKIGEDIKIQPTDVLSASSFADWVVPVALSSESWLLRTLKYDALKTPAGQNAAEPEQNNTKDINIEGILDFKYKYQDISDLPTKISVSEIKSKNSTQINPVPQFLKEKRSDGAYYGTAVHTVMQNIIPKPDMDKEYISLSLSEMVKNGILTDAEAALIKPEKILLFYHSEIGQRIIAAKKVYREQSFEVPVPVQYLYPGTENDGRETILLQGIIDCFFEENGYLVLVDYKTDSFSDISQMHEKYDIQLELYKYALEKITGLTVKDKYIYLFFDNSVI